MEFKKDNSTENEISKEKKEIVDKLISLGKETGNPIDFKDYGIEPSKTIENNYKKEILEDLSSQEIENVNKMLEILTSFISTPIFTDSFHKEHGKRRMWQWEVQINNKIDKKTFSLYKENRLRGNKCFHIISALEVLEYSIINSNVKKEIASLRQKIPSVFLTDEEKEGEIEYHSLSDDKKIEAVKELSKIVQDALNIFLEKN
jgi:hypothetical protein